MPDYNVSNPHPGFGKDPNILNEFGHNAYPKWVEHPHEKDTRGFPKRVLVQNKKEEDVVLKAPKEPVKDQSKEPVIKEQSKEGWGK